MTDASEDALTLFVDDVSGFETDLVHDRGERSRLIVVHGRKQRNGVEKFRLRRHVSILL